MKPIKPPVENCWKRIGVWGTERPRCPILDDVIHCCNCDVFTAAGRKLFERSLPDEYQREWTEIMAAEKDNDIPGTISVIVFRIEEEWLALRTRILDYILDSESLKHHTLPHRKNSVLIGIINIHGDIQLCISLKDLLKIEAREGKKKITSGKHRMIVINANGDQWVFPVNQIAGVHSIHPESFENVPVTVVKSKSTYTKEIFLWKGKHVAFLDDELLCFSVVKKVQ